MGGHLGPSHNQGYLLTPPVQCEVTLPPLWSMCPLQHCPPGHRPVQCAGVEAAVASVEPAEAGALPPFSGLSIYTVGPLLGAVALGG